jgi:chromosome segregation ATPase
VLDPAAASVTASSATATVQVPAGFGDDQHANTDTEAEKPTARAALSAASAEERRRQESELQSRTAALQEAQERLASHGQRLLQLEQARDEALMAQAAAAQRAAGAEQRAAGAERDASAAEQRATAFELRIAQLEQRTAQLSAELAERQATAAQHTTRLEESARARTAAEQTAAAASAELTQARALASTAAARAAGLQQRLEQQQGDKEAQRVRELQQQQAQADARHAHVAGVMEDLHDERARAMSYLESLQTLERRRELAQHLVTDLYREAEVGAAELARLTRELATAEERASVRAAELAQRVARIAQLEQQVSTLGTMLAQREAQLQEGRQEADGLRTSITRLQAEINTGAESLRALEARAVQRDSSEAQQQSELQQLRGELGRSGETLEATRKAAAAAMAHAGSQQAALGKESARAAELEASLTAERHRALQLESELATVRGEMEEWGGALRSAQQERGGHLASIAAAEARVRQLEQQAATREESARVVQAEHAEHAARVRELESDLHVAEEALHRLEADARSRGSRVAELERSSPQWRETAGEARHAATDSNPVLRDAKRFDEDSGPAAEAVPDGAARLLIHSEEGREVVHVLGRKTSIGRTPDNDLQLEAKFVSRHHAVILAGPVNTVIEDLNSTNGVQVNGRRVTRQTLRDGDQIAIGRAHYRFALRKLADKR